MIFCGHDEMRKRTQEQGSDRLVKRVHTEQPQNNNNNKEQPAEPSEAASHTNISSVSESFGYRSMNNRSRKQSGLMTYSTNTHIRNSSPLLCGRIRVGGQFSSILTMIRHVGDPPSL
jgi:hypothetical protein